MKRSIFVIMCPSIVIGVMSMHSIDYAADITAGGRLMMAQVGEREISATGVPRGSGRSRCAVLGVSPTALRGRGTEVSGNDLPVVEVSAGGWQVQHDAPHRGLDSGAELQELFAQSADLRASVGGARGSQAQLLVEHVGGGAQKTPQLIGEEAGATGAIDLKSAAHP
jgi:hypothetical protein